jgi:hypothetical protein
MNSSFFALFVLLLAVAYAPAPPPPPPPGSCNPDLMYDAYLTFVADARMQLNEFFTPIPAQHHGVMHPHCAAQFRNHFGIETSAFYGGTGSLPAGFFGFNLTVTAYRIYSIVSAEYPNNSPMTNGKVLDDVYYLSTTQDVEITTGMWKDMAVEMGMNTTWPAGSFVVCGQYRGYQNFSDGSLVEAFPSITYFSPMPMTAVYLGVFGDSTNSNVGINCELESPLWGKGRALGMALTQPLPDGRLWPRWRNTLSFPDSVYSRPSLDGRIPRSSACEPL